MSPTLTLQHVDQIKYNQITYKGIEGSYLNNISGGSQINRDALIKKYLKKNNILESIETLEEIIKIESEVNEKFEEFKNYDRFKNHPETKAINVEIAKIKDILKETKPAPTPEIKAQQENLLKQKEVEFKALEKKLFLSRLDKRIAELENKNRSDDDDNKLSELRDRKDNFIHLKNIENLKKSKLQEIAIGIKNLHDDKENGLTNDDRAILNDKLLSLANFKDIDKNDKIEGLIGSINTDDFNNLVDEENTRQKKLATLKADTVSYLYDQIQDCFDEDFQLYEDDFNELLSGYKLLLGNDLSKEHEKILKEIEELYNEGKHEKLYEYLTENIDLSGVADGIIGTYFEGKNLCDKYLELLNKYHDVDATQVDAKNQAMQALINQASLIKEFNKQYALNVNLNNLKTIPSANKDNDIAQFNPLNQEFLIGIKDKFNIPFGNNDQDVTQDSVKNIKNAGSDASLTTKANILKIIEGQGREYIPDEKFFKSHGYFTEDKKWFQFKDGFNGLNEESKAIIRTHCKDPLDPKKEDAIRIFYDNDSVKNSRTSKFMKHDDFKNKTIVESTVYNPNSWVRTSNDNGIIKKTLNDEKMQISLDDVKGFSIRLMPEQSQSDPTKFVMKPVLVYDSSRDKDMDSAKKYNKLLNQIKRLYSDYTFANNDKNNPIEFGINDLIGDIKSVAEVNSAIRRSEINNTNLNGVSKANDSQKYPENSFEGRLLKKINNNINRGA